MLRKIRVYGKLAKFLKQRVFEADVASAAEAVRFLVVNFPQLRPHMAEQYYKVSVGTYALTAEELHDPAGQQEIKIVPVLAGAGSNSNVSSILIGAALITASFFFPAAAGAVPALKIGASTFSAFGASLFGIGAFLTLSGVAGLLTPTPPGPEEQKDPRKSYSFSGVQNTSRQGIPVPVVYGETVVGSVVVSAAFDTVNTK